MFSRRNGDSGLNKGVIQTVQLSFFKKKGNDQCLIFSKIDGKENEFKITKSHNSFLTIIVLNSFLNVNRPKKLKNQKEKIFNGLLIQNIPRQFFNYQHENTLEELWAFIKQKSKTIQQIQGLINEYPIVQFVMQCYGRKIIKDYIDETLGLDLLGNEQKIIIDFQTEIRGELLSYLATVLKMEVKIIYSGTEKNEDTVEQNFGNRDAPWKVFIYDENDYYRFSVSEEQQTHKLISISSSTNIYQPPHKRKLLNTNTQSEVTQTTAEGQSYHRLQVQSKSANKDQMYRCRVCGSKVRFCQCEQKKKGNTPRPVNTTINPGRSVFDGLAFDRPVISRRREDISAKLCFNCNRLACICKK